MKLYLSALLLVTSILISPVSQASNNFLVISDIHLNTSATPNSMEINPAKPNSNANDLDPVTFSKLIAMINQNIPGNVPKPDFIILLGDLVGHASSRPQGAIAAEASVFKQLKSTFPYPIFYTAGNNDSLAADYGPFSSGSGSPYNIAKQNTWAGFLSTDTTCATPATKFPCVMPVSSAEITNGYYSAYLQSGFRLITLNTVLFSRTNFAPAAKDEIDWLRLQLADAQTKKESVLIAMHIPPGNNVYDGSLFWAQNQPDFLQLIKDNNSIIVGILASHTHEDELKVIRNTGVGVYFTAALSTSHGNAPSVKTFYYGSTNGKWNLLNTKTFDFRGKNGTITFNNNPTFNFNAQYSCSGADVSLSACLNNVTAGRMMESNYFSAENPYFGGTMGCSGCIYINP